MGAVTAMIMPDGVIRYLPNPENPEPKRSIKYHFFRFSDFLIILFRIFRESDYKGSMCWPKVVRWSRRVTMGRFVRNHGA
uniref:Uncharacterized protein n=1 Tax=Candidatus Kentrum sp. LPFa TaxID=2126335 RepID=A0A450XRU0_9GAMM|nr:MAG: hypothetical protein BECKLPF1236A_GA0070988_101697 [Candidatus Kentron sp. LPFa]VFK31995.1 MAG: hypothetical protein BECKLPF1236C_GA0070990_101548 [Candidatus Kentron sp. LPFa]